MGEEFFVSIRQGLGAINIAFYYTNGVQLCSERFPIKYEEGMTGFDCILSPNGKYLMIYKWFSEENDLRGASGTVFDMNQSLNGNQDEDPERDHTRYSQWKSVFASVYKIVLVRPKSRHERLSQIVQKNHNILAQQPKQKKFRERLFQGVK